MAIGEQKYWNFFDIFNVKLILVPKEAHHRMALIERLRAMRRFQIFKILKEEPNRSIAEVVRVACIQRNRLRLASGSSPYLIVFGCNPRHNNGIMDNPPDIGISSEFSFIPCAWSLVSFESGTMVRY